MTHISSSSTKLIYQIRNILSRHAIGRRLQVDPSISRQMSTSSRQTCLYNFHKNRLARLEPFAGYMMPILYKDQSIKLEHMYTRENATVFDVSHMMQTLIHGKDRVKFMESLTVADIEGLGLNKCVLSVFTNETGGIIDDCIISKRDNYLHLVSNAGNADIVWEWLNKNVSSRLDVRLERLDGKGLIALQGPKAAEVLQPLVKSNLSDLEFMNTLDAEVESIGICQITRCGYTGEDGFEISIDPALAEKLMTRFVSNGDVKPAGLGARDTLRLEAGLCLHGHDITDTVTPVEAGLSWTIHKRRRAERNFLGAEIILDQLKNGSKIKRVGLVAVAGGPPAREGTKVINDEGAELGLVTSGTFSPKLEKNISMAYLPTSISTDYDKIVNCQIRGKNYDYNITKMPFVKSNYFIKRRD